MKKPSFLFGPWVFMVILPFLFPIVFIALLITAAVKGSNEPLKTLHYWLFYSLIGLAMYAGIDYMLGALIQDMVGSSG